MTFPAATREATLTLDEFTESSRFVNVPFHTKLSPGGAMALVSLLDLFRENALRSLIREGKRPLFNSGSVVQQASGRRSYFWLVRNLRDFLRGGVPGEQVEEGLKELEEKGLAGQRDGVVPDRRCFGPGHNNAHPGLRVRAEHRAHDFPGCMRAL
ncbi:MAG: hypothetical protein ACPLPR_06870 [Bacillota bacterium]